MLAQAEVGPDVADIVGSHMKAAGLASKPIFRVHRVGAVFVKWHHRNA